jgi:hypothetical protein
MSTEEVIAALRRDETAARQRHARAEAGLVQAEARAAAAREDLQAGYGLSTVEECRAALAELDGQMAAEADRVRQQLALAGGAQ